MLHTLIIYNLTYIKVAFSSFPLRLCMVLIDSKWHIKNIPKTDKSKMKLQSQTVFSLWTVKHSTWHTIREKIKSFFNQFLWRNVGWKVSSLFFPDLKVNCYIYWRSPPPAFDRASKASLHCLDEKSGGNTSSQCHLLCCFRHNTLLNLKVCTQRAEKGHCFNGRSVELHGQCGSEILSFISQNKFFQLQTRLHI